MAVQSHYVMPGTEGSGLPVLMQSNPYATAAFRYNPAAGSVQPLIGYPSQYPHVVNAPDMSYYYAAVNSPMLPPYWNAPVQQVPAPVRPSGGGGGGGGQAAKKQAAPATPAAPVLPKAQASKGRYNPAAAGPPAQNIPAPPPMVIDPVTGRPLSGTNTRNWSFAPGTGAPSFTGIDMPIPWADSNPPLDSVQSLAAGMQAAQQRAAAIMADRQAAQLERERIMANPEVENFANYYSGPMISDEAARLAQDRAQAINASNGYALIDINPLNYLPRGLAALIQSYLNNPGGNGNAR